MNARELLRAAKDFSLSDKAAGERPLSSTDKTEDRQRVEQMAERIAELQYIFYAEHRRKLLVILQGMDTSGKDGTIKGVFGHIDPLGIRTVAFKTPTTVETEHDFLWRIHSQVPAQGEMAIFNRSQYEDVVITRVHDWIDEKECKRRYAHIRDFERMLVETGSVVLKFFLHISSDEQKKRLEARIADPSKNWKFDPLDLEERKYWPAYQRLYKTAIRETDTDAAPWYVIPADSKTHRNLAIGSVVLETMESLKLSYPPANPEYRALKVT
jgi:PPK2 family polyphosphate:nucleotide phosphotransferase